MTTAPNSGPPSLTFPPETFAKLSPHPYLLAHLSPTESGGSVRPNGRLPSEFRSPHVNTGSLTHAEGSAVVRLGDTTAVCGVRGEILLASDVGGYRADLNASSNTGDERRQAAKELKDLDLLVPNIELATGCSPAFLPGQPPGTLAQSLSTRVYSLLHSSRLVDIEDLRIWYTPDASDGDTMDQDDDMDREGGAVIKAYWTLYIDILFISLDGNAFDAAWAATLTALQNVRLPRAYWDMDAEMVLCSDELLESRMFSLRSLPVACTFAVFKTQQAPRKREAWDDKLGEGKNCRQWILADPNTFEEGLCDESITVVVDCSRGSQGRGQRQGTRILAISKAGGMGVGGEEMRGLVAMAEKRWLEWERVLGGTGKT